MSELLTTSTDKARKAHSLLLQALAPIGTATNIAREVGVSEATISRAKADSEAVIALLYRCGFKVVSNDYVCVKRDRYEAMATIAQAAMADEATARKLMWESE